MRLRTFLPALALILGLSWAAVAQPRLPLLGAGPPGAVAAYVGPGDVASGASAWYGVRGYNAAYATGANKSLNVRCSSGGSSGTTFDVVILSNGNLDTGTASSTCGTDGVVTASGAATKTLTVGAVTSGACKPGDQVTDGTTPGNILPGTYITANGTGSGGTGTYTTNLTLGTFSTDTVTCAASMAVVTMYDQTGNGVNVTQGTAASQPILLVNVANSQPSIYYNGGQLLTGTLPAIAQPWQFVGAVNNTASQAFSSIAGRNGIWAYGLTAASAGYFLYAGAAVTGTMSAGVIHVLIGIASGATSQVIIDNVSTGSINAGTTAIPAAAFGVGAVDTGAGSSFITGFLPEVGVWPPPVLTGTQLTNVCHNMHNFYATPTSC